MGDRGTELARAQILARRQVRRRPVANRETGLVSGPRRLVRQCGAAPVSARTIRFSVDDQSAAVRPQICRRSATGLAQRPVDPLSDQAMTALSIVVPCYNEQPCLGALHERLGAAARAAA